MDKTMPAALASLAHTKGRFAWVIYDAGMPDTCTFRLLKLGL